MSSLFEELQAAFAGEEDPQQQDPISGYKPDWRKKVKVSPSPASTEDDPLAGYNSGWRRRAKAAASEANASSRELEQSPLSERGGAALEQSHTSPFTKEKTPDAEKTTIGTRKPVRAVSAETTRAGTDALRTTGTVDVPDESRDVAHVRTPNGLVKVGVVRRRGDAVDVISLGGESSGQSWSVPANTIEWPTKEKTFDAAPVRFAEAQRETTPLKPVDGSPFDTGPKPFHPDMEKAFQSWAAEHRLTDVDSPSSHYDYRGAFQAGVEPDANGHWPDTYKQHGHPTFSTESKYSKGPEDGGHWSGNDFIPAPPRRPNPAPRDVSRAGAPDANPGAKQQTGIAKFGSRVFGAGASMLEHPVETITGMATLPAEALAKVALYSDESKRPGEFANAGVDPDLAPAPKVSPVEALHSAAQLAAMGVAGPMESAMERHLAEAIATRAAAGYATRGLGKAAKVVSRGTTGSLVGSTFTPDQPEIGATLGALFGAGHAAIGGEHVPVRGVPAERQIRTPPKPAVATATFAGEPPPTGGEYHVESLLDQVKKAVEQAPPKPATEPLAAASTTLEKPHETTEPAQPPTAPVERSQTPVERGSGRDGPDGSSVAPVPPRPVAPAAGPTAEAQRAVTDAQAKVALAKRPPIEAAQGEDSHVFLSDGGKVQTKYAVVDASQLDASHDPITFSENPNYPAGVQGRAYHGTRGTAARQQVEIETGRLRPDVLLDMGSGVTDGPPVVTHHGIVVAGNQRAMMLQRAAQTAPGVYADYREQLEAHAHKFGINPDEIAPMQSPVLVRVINDPAVDVNDPKALGEFNRVSDQAPTKTKDQLSAAMSRATAMRGATEAMQHLTDTMDPDSTVRDYLGTTAGRDFVRKLVADGVIAQQELPSFVHGGTNSVNEEGKQRIEDMMNAAAIGDADVISRAPASALRKIQPSVPAIIAANRSGDYSIETTLREALDTLASAAAMRDESGSGKTSLDAFLAQGDMFGRSVDPAAADLARLIDRKPQKEIAKIMREYARIAGEAAQGMESHDMFGYTPEAPAELRDRLFGGEDKGPSGDVVREDPLSNYSPNWRQAALDIARRNLAEAEQSGDERAIARARNNLSDLGEHYETHRETHRMLGVPASAPVITAGQYSSETYKGHPDFKAAKGGDMAAAVRFVADKASPESVEQAARAFGPDVTYLAPVAMERSGINAIPRTMAEYYAAKTGALADTKIVQANRAYHTGADLMERLVAPVYFDGPIVKGRRYVLTDDVTMSGGTLASLADFVQARGGIVAGVVSLANASRSGQLAPDQKTVQELERRFGNVIRQEFSIEPQALTADEAQYLIGFRDADEIRNRAATARRARAERLREASLPKDAGQGNEGGRVAEDPLVGYSPNWRDVDAKLAELKARMSAGERPKSDQIDDISPPIDLTDMTAAEWWSALSRKERAALLPTGVTAGWPDFGADPNPTAHDAKMFVQKAFHNWRMDVVRNDPEGGGYVREPALHYDPAQADLFEKRSPVQKAVGARAEAKASFGSVAKREKMANEVERILAAGLTPIGERVGQMDVAQRMWGRDRAKGVVNLVGMKLGTVDAIARAMAVFRHPGMEIMHYIILDDTNEVLAHIADSSGALNWNHYKDGVQRAIATAKQVGGTKVIPVHNHPSGDPTPSSDDRGVTAVAGRLFQEAGLKMLGHLVINHGTVSWLTPSDVVGEGHLSYGIGDRGFSVPDMAERSWDASLARPVLTSPEAVARLAIDAVAPDALTVIHVDMRRRSLAVSPKPREAAATLRDWLADEMRAVGSAAVFLIAPPETARQLANAGVPSKVTDILQVEEQSHGRPPKFTSLEDSDRVLRYDEPSEERGRGFDRSRPILSADTGRSAADRSDGGSAAAVRGAEEEGSPGRVGEEDREQWQALTAREREILDSLTHEPISYNVGRNMPNEYRTLLGQGLAFRSHNAITITEKGRDVADRVAETAPRYGSQTDTPEFKRWFGDSKVVDESGQPLRVYHGSKDVFDVFDANRHETFYGGGAIYFTDSPQIASDYAIPEDRNLDKIHPEDRPSVYPAYLSIQNPLVVDAKGRTYWEVTDRALRAARQGGHDGVIVKNVLDHASAKRSMQPGGAMTTYIAFSAKQVKSATGNSGAFDPTSPSIVREKDLFGYEAHSDSPHEESLFAGNEPRRSLAHTEAQARSDIDRIRQELDLIDKQGRRSKDPAEKAKLIGRRRQLAAQLVPLEKLVNRDKAISADEIKTRAAAGEEQSRLFERPPKYDANGVVEATSASLQKPAAEVGRFRDALRRIFAPAHRSTEAGEMAHLVRASNAEMAHRNEQARESLKAFSKQLGRMKKEAQLDFIDRMETGQDQKTPQLTAAAKAIRGVLDEARDEIRALGTGKLQQYIENYFPHIWADPEKAKTVIGVMLGKRPLEGGKSFLKKRSIPTTAEGIEMGLEPATYNPVDLALIKLREMNKYLFGQRIWQEAKKVGLVKYIPSTSFGPAGYVRINDPSAFVYGPSEVSHFESTDRIVWQKLTDIIKSLDVAHRRSPTVGPALGYAHGDQLIETRFGGDLGTVMHELGHILDERYGLKQRFKEAIGAAPKRTAQSGKKAGQQVPDYSKKGGDTPEARARRKSMNEQLRNLANLRLESMEGVPETKDIPKTGGMGGGGGGVGRDYLHSWPEKAANMLEAYIKIPQRMKEIAPDIFEVYDSIIGQHEELRPIKRIQPTLSRDVHYATTDVGGIVVKGQYWAPEPVAHVMNAYLSPGLRGRNPWYDAYMRVGNTLNQAQLGFSAFHLGFTSIDAMVSQVALGLKQLETAGRGRMLNVTPGARGRMFRDGILRMASFPVAPLTTALRGDRFIKAYLSSGELSPEMAAMIQALVQGGGRVKMDDFYKTGAIHSFVESFRQRRPLGVVGHAIPALLELSVKPVLEFVVPRQKLGVFTAMAQYELQRLGPTATPAEARKAFGDAWDSVDNRLGQLVYDNLFWHRTTKDWSMASVRAVGWNLGTIREVGGGASDILKLGAGTAKRAIGGGKNEDPRAASNEMTHRASYVPALLLVAMTLGAVTQYLFTGEGPQELKDYFYPKTGKKNAEGNDERVQLPTYMKDIVAYGKHPVQTIEHKVHPLLSAIVSMLQNKDYYGDEVRNPDDPLVTQMKQVGEFILKHQATPFSVQNLMEEKKREQGATEKVGGFVGVTAAPREAVRTPAQNRMAEMLALRGHASRTPEQKEHSDTKSDLRTGRRERTIPRDSIGRLQRAGELSRTEARSLLSPRTREDPRITKFKQLSDDEAREVYALGSSEEKRLWHGAMHIKDINARRSKAGMGPIHAPHP